MEAGADGVVEVTAAVIRPAAVIYGAVGAASVRTNGVSVLRSSTARPPVPSPARRRTVPHHTAVVAAVLVMVAPEQQCLAVVAAGTKSRFQRAIIASPAERAAGPPTR